MSCLGFCDQGHSGGLCTIRLVNFESLGSISVSMSPTPVHSWSYGSSDVHFVPTLASFIRRMPVSNAQVATERFNTTHTIVSLSFGNHSHPASDSKMDPASSSILEGHEKIVQDAHAMHQVTRYFQTRNGERDAWCHSGFA